MMHGGIEMHSEPGRGTRFTVSVSLPVATAQEIAQTLTSAPVASNAMREPLAGVRVLVVDDHPANRIVLDGQIRLLGAVPRLAENGRVALARRARHHRRDSDRLLNARDERRTTGASHPRR